MRNNTCVVWRRSTRSHTNHVVPRRNFTVFATIRAGDFRQQHPVATGGILNSTVSTRLAGNVEFYVRVQVYIDMHQSVFVGATEPKDLGVVDRDLKVDLSVRSLAGKLRFCVQVAVVRGPFT